MATDKVTVTYVADNQPVAKTVYSATANSALEFNQLVPGPSTNQEYDIVIPVSALQSCCFTADQACTIKTNSSSAPDNTIILAPGQTVSWVSGMPTQFAQPLTVAVTKIFVTCTPATNLTIRATYNV